MHVIKSKHQWQLRYIRIGKPLIPTCKSADRIERILKHWPRTKINIWGDSIILVYYIRVLIIIKSRILSSKSTEGLTIFWSLAKNAVRFNDTKIKCKFFIPLISFKKYSWHSPLVQLVKAKVLGGFIDQKTLLVRW